MQNVKIAVSRGQPEFNKSLSTQVFRLAYSSCECTYSIKIKCFLWSIFCLSLYYYSALLLFFFLDSTAHLGPKPTTPQQVGTSLLTVDHFFSFTWTIFGLFFLYCHVVDFLYAVFTTVFCVDFLLLPFFFAFIRNWNTWIILPIMTLHHRQ